MLAALKLVKESPIHLNKIKRATNLRSFSTQTNLNNIRTFATSSKQKTTIVPSHTHSLKDEFPGTPQIASQKGVPLSKPETKITRLPNGLRVVTEETFGQTSSVALFIDAGTVYETDETRGISHMMERMAFKSTSNRDQRSVIHELEEMGGNVTSSSSREMMGFAADVVREYVPNLLKIMADNVINPLYLEEEFNEQKEVIHHEITEIAGNPEQYLPELMHEVAIQGPLGKSMFVKEESLSIVTSSHLREFHNKFYRPERMVLAVAGAEHNHIVELASQLFKFPFQAKSEIIKLPSKYVGGELILPRDPKEKPRFGDDRQLSHLILAFEGVSMSSPDIYLLATLNTLFGGGGSFSSGGPGKGMYSRLYREVLNGNNFVEQANAFMSPYTETGIWGISTTVVDAKLPEMMQKLMYELCNVCFWVHDEDFRRAKNQLKSQIFMSLESRSALADDLGRQVMVYDKRHTPEEVGKKIDSLQREQMHQFMRNMMVKPLTIVAYGEGDDGLPDAQGLRKYFEIQLR